MIFAYSITSSGKTYMMQGTKAEPGVIPWIVRVSDLATRGQSHKYLASSGHFQKEGHYPEIPNVPLGLLHGNL